MRRVRGRTGQDPGLPSVGAEKPMVTGPVRRQEFFSSTTPLPTMSTSLLDNPAEETVEVIRHAEQGLITNQGVPALTAALKENRP